MAREVAADHARVFLVVLDGMRARPDQRHCPVEHVEELRQLVDARPPNNQKVNKMTNNNKRTDCLLIYSGSLTKIDR